MARLQSIKARRSEVRLYMTRHFFFVPYLWPDQRTKTFFMCLSKMNKQQEIATFFFLRLRGYRILQQLIGLCIYSFSDFNIIFSGNSFSGCINSANKGIAVQYILTEKVMLLVHVGVRIMRFLMFIIFGDWPLIKPIDIVLSSV